MVSLADVLKIMLPSAIIQADFSVRDDGSGEYIALWNSAKLGPQPTAEQIEAARPAAEKAQQKSALQAQLDAADAGTVRVLEDLLDVLASKNVLRESDLPASAQSKLASRRALRRQLKNLA